MITFPQLLENHHSHEQLRINFTQVKLQVLKCKEISLNNSVRDIFQLNTNLGLISVSESYHQYEM